MREFDADPKQFDVKRHDEERYVVELNDDDDSVAYVDHEESIVEVYTTGAGGARNIATVPLDLFKAVATESDL